MPTLRAAFCLQAVLGLLLSVVLTAGALVQPAGPSWLVGTGELESAPAAAPASPDRLQVVKQPAPALPLACAPSHAAFITVPRPTAGMLRQVRHGGRPRPGILGLGPTGARAPPRA